jgi:serine/threonine protein kinase/outer membrane biosynthesis protein TonB
LVNILPEVGTESDALFGAETEPERYQLVQELASGGMATVFLARTHDAAGAPQLVAVKRIHRHLAREQSFLEMFFDEARIAAQIQHPNVCALHDFGRSGAVFYIAMEYVLGETLFELLRVLSRDRRLRESLQWQIFAATIVAGACDGLQAVHELTDEQGRPMHVVHRDISPGNIFVTYEGGVKVVDFGIAYAQNKMHHTQTGTLKGKLGYMPPELIAGDGRDVDRRADIWALGVCLWELLTGSLLFGGHNDAATMFNVMQRAIPSLLTVAGAPARLDDIVSRALDRDRNGRYPTAQAFARDLRDWIASTGQPVGSAELAEFMQTRFAPQYARKMEVIEEAQTATGAVGLGVLLEDQITRQLPIRSPSWPRVDSAELMRPPGSADSLPVRIPTSPPPRPPSADPFSLTVPADPFAVPVASDPGPAMSAAPSVPLMPDRRRRRWPAYSVALGGMALAVGGTGLALWYQPDSDMGEGALAVAEQVPPAPPPGRGAQSPDQPSAVPAAAADAAVEASVEPLPEPSVEQPVNPVTPEEPAESSEDNSSSEKDGSAKEDDRPSPSSRRKRAEARREKARRARERADRRSASAADEAAEASESSEEPEEEPEPPLVAEPAPTQPAPPKQPPKPPKRTGPLAATVSIASLEVRGSLVNSMVRSGIDRLVPSLEACYREAATAAGRNDSCSVRVVLSINETGQVARATAAGAGLRGLDACVKRVAKRVRTVTPPDVGGATASFEVKYTPQGE